MSWVEYGPGKKNEKIAHKRKEPYDALGRREQKKEATRKEATRNMKRGRTTLKSSGERPKNKPPQKRSEVKGIIKTTKAKIWMKDSLRKSPTKQNKNKKIARDRERETELTHLFKNKSFDISLHREFLYTSHAGLIFTWGVSLTYPVLASFLFSSGEFLLHIPC